MASCPSIDELDELLAGLLGERYEAVFEHVTACDMCQTRLESLDEPCDDFVRAVQALMKNMRLNS